MHILEKPHRTSHNGQRSCPICSFCVFARIILILVYRPYDIYKTLCCIYLFKAYPRIPYQNTLYTRIYSRTPKHMHQIKVTNDVRNPTIYELSINTPHRAHIINILYRERERYIYILIICPWHQMCRLPVGQLNTLRSLWHCLR